MADIGAEAGLSSADSLCWTSAWLATFHQGASQTGTSYRLPVGKWDYATLVNNIGNDTISSLSVPAGMLVQLFSEAGCTSASTTGTYSGTVNTLGPMDDQTSCLIISPGVTLYASQNYGGASQTLGGGTYGSSSFGAVGDNNAESLIAPPGVVVHLCDTSAQTNCYWYTGKWTTLNTLNNIGSYVEVIPGAVVYPAADYSSTPFTFTPGTYVLSSYAIGQNTISSLIVSPGLKATLCSNSSGTGDCKVFTGWNTYVGTTTAGVSMNDHSNYIKIEAI